MLSKNELKYIQSLCQKKQRQASGLFIAEGPKIVDELLNSHFTVNKVYATDEWDAGKLADPSILTRVSAHELAKISGLQTPQQVLAVARQYWPDAVPQLNQKITLVLDGIQDPGNLGTIIRIADWFGIQEIVCSLDTVDCYNPKVVQATMGSLLRVKIWYEALPAFLAKQQMPILGALLSGQSVYATQVDAPSLLVIGNEAKGIREELLPLINQPISIPGKGGAESLNAGVATGILVSHLLH
ncbi:MAG: TrmH family RNA methyltransferase [Chitinophagaceae bacterium]